MASKGKLLLISGEDDNSLRVIAAPLTSEGYEIVRASSAKEAAATLGTQEFVALVADILGVPHSDRLHLRALHKDRGDMSMFWLESPQTLAPSLPVPLRRLSWPLPQGIIDQVRATQKSVVFLIDPTLYGSKMMHTLLQQSYIQSMHFEYFDKMPEFLQQQVRKKPASPTPPRKKSMWEKMTGKGDEAEEAPVDEFCRVFVTLYNGTPAQAETLDEKIRKMIPEAVCFLITTADPARAAAEAARAKGVVYLMREDSGRIPGILESASHERVAVELKEKERILLLDNNKEAQAALAQFLLGEGYEVVTADTGEHALSLAKEPGSFHLAVLGIALANMKFGGKELAEGLQKNDPDLRIIFMVDQFPVESVMKRLTEVAALGVDDQLLRPIDKTVLKISVEKALDRRRDIDKIKRLNKALDEEKSKLAQVNSFQTKFFQMVAHDVKNPLTAIMGYAEVLAMKLKDRPSELKSASHIHSAAKALNMLISDLVDLAAIETGKLRVEMGALDVAGVINEVKSRIDVVAAKRRINFSVQLPSSIPQLVGDPNRLGQVIQNLCTNAIQYTKEGGKVMVEAQVSPEWVTIGVRDTGIGIAKEDLPRIFERFFQTEEAQKMRRAGFGLGLKIAREIVQRHGGEMGIESELGVGSRFFFTLPVKGPAKGNPAAS